MGQCWPTDKETIDMLKDEPESKNEIKNGQGRVSGGSFSYGDPELKEPSIVRDALASKLSNAKVSDLNISKKVITLNASTNAKQAVEILLKNKIRAAPVIDNDKYIGALDLRDTLKYLLEQYKNESFDDSKHNESITTAFTLRIFKTVNENDNLLNAANILAHGAHIVGVIKNNILIGIINQGELFDYSCGLWNDSSNNCSLQELLALKYITSPIKSVRNNISAYKVFSTMSDLNLSGLAIIDENGMLIHNTSSTDIKLWLLSDNISLQDPIEDFLVNIRKQPSLTDRYPITHCNLQQTFRRALSKLQATKYHRLWIVDNETHPIGVLALTDVFKFVCKTKK